MVERLEVVVPDEVTSRLAQMASESGNTREQLIAKALSLFLECTAGWRKSGPAECRMDSALFRTSYILLWMLTGVAFLLWFAVIRQIGVLHMRLGPRGGYAVEDGPEPGSLVPQIQLKAADDSDVTFPAAEGETLALILSTSCPLCEVVANAAASLIRRKDTLRTVMLIPEDSSPAITRFADGHTLPRSLVVPFPRAAAFLNVETTPMAILLDNGGRVVSKALINSLEQLELFLVESLAEHEVSSDTALLQLDGY